MVSHITSHQDRFLNFLLGFFLSSTSWIDIIDLNHLQRHFSFFESIVLESIFANENPVLKVGGSVDEGASTRCQYQDPSG